MHLRHRFPYRLWHVTAATVMLQTEYKKARMMSSLPSAQFLPRYFANSSLKETTAFT